ncbi:MAG: membrane fusion protein (multidrug efflux system) [Candidatus Binatia bacterium]|jgi:membrane fusion protein (multidrug efflux system)
MMSLSTTAPGRSVRKRSLFALLVVVLILGAGCEFQEGMAEMKKNAAGKKDKKEEGVPVEVATLVRGPIEEVIKASNHLEAEQTVKVFSRASNLLVELLVEEGDLVKKKQVLARLQNDDQQTTCDKALSQLNQAKANFKRTEQMFKGDLVSQRDYDDGKYGLEQLQLAMNEAQRQLDFTEIKAPIAGTITTRLVRLGDQVNPNQHLFDIIDFDSIVALVYVPEKRLSQLEIKKPARITAQSLGDEVFEGFIKRISPVVDSKSGTVKVTLGVKGGGKLRPGMFVDAEIIVSTHPNALLVSKRSIVYDSDQMFVYRLGESNRVARVLVEPVLTDKDHIEPAAGFEAGDQIVIAGQTGLKDGGLVTLPGASEPEEKVAAEASESTNSPAAGKVSG